MGDPVFKSMLHSVLADQPSTAACVLTTTFCTAQTTEYSKLLHTAAHQLTLPSSPGQGLSCVGVAFPRRATCGGVNRVNPSSDPLVFFLAILVFENFGQTEVQRVEVSPTECRRDSSCLASPGFILTDFETGN